MNTKIAIVTGATSGLGRAFIEQWKEETAPFQAVWLVARHEDALYQLAQSLPWSTRTFALDLAKTADRDVLYAALREAQPNVSMLVNSAGFGKIGAAVSLDAREQASMVRLNCEALTEITQAVLPYMTRGSAIFEIASVAAFLPQPNFAVYAATKAYVLSYTRALHTELHREGIRAIAVCPNPMDTGFFNRAGKRPAGVKTLFFENPKKVAAKALRDMEKGRDVSTCSKPATFIRLASKVLPHRLLLKIEALVLK